MYRTRLPFFEDVELGVEIGPYERVVGDEEVEAFCRLWGNETPNRFTDQELAENSGLAGPIIPGIMSMALMAQLLTSWAGTEALKDLDLVFRQPVPHNKPLKITATVTDTSQANGEYLVTCDILMTGAEGERYVGGTALVALPSRSLENK